jgi:hypothetical protein
MTRQGADRRLRQLRNAGRVSSKKIGASLVWFAPEQDGAQTPTDAARADAVDDATDAPADPPPDAHGADTPAEEDALDAVLADIPGTVDPADARDAILAAREYLRTDGPASKAGFIRDVMPEHALGYDAEKALADLTDPDSRERGSWWRHIVRPGLEAIDGVEKPVQGASKWTATGRDK